jgi:hypothetical protein
MGYQCGTKLARRSSMKGKAAICGLGSQLIARRIVDRGLLAKYVSQLGVEHQVQQQLAATALGPSDAGEQGFKLLGRWFAIDEFAAPMAEQVIV